MYTHRIRRPYKRVPLGPRLQPRVAPPSPYSWCMAVFLLVAGASLVWLVVAGVLLP